MASGGCYENSVHGRIVNDCRSRCTGGGKVVGLDGPPPPKRVAITEWDSLEQAEAFFKSKAWTDLGPDRDKAIKTIRRYAVEAVN